MTAEPGGPRARPLGRLAMRVALTAIVSGAMAGTLAALLAMGVLDRLATQHADRRLRGATDVLAGELDEQRDEGEWEPLGDVVQDENDELVTSGVRLAMYSGTHRIAGDGWAPRVAHGRCEAFGPVGSRVRACGRPYGTWTLVAAARHDGETLPRFYLLATFGALITGAAVAALGSLRLSRWALRPLNELNRAIRRLDPAIADTSSLGTKSDCEEVELVREALVDLGARMQLLLGQSQRFAANAAHELRTPLTAIRGELELLLEGSTPSLYREALMRVSERARQLGKLTEKLLVLASPAERVRLGAEPVALAEVVEEAVLRLPTAVRERVQLSLAGEGLVRAEPTLVHSMVDNAIDNALKFSGDAPVCVALTEELADDNNAVAQVRLQVRDEGPGIAAEVRERVFEPFYRAHSDATPGHGLGLSLIGHIARVLGGNAAFIDYQRGACLQITLPAWAAPIAQHDAPHAPRVD